MRQAGTRGEARRAAEKKARRQLLARLGFTHSTNNPARHPLFINLPCRRTVVVLHRTGCCSPHQCTPCQLRPFLPPSSAIDPFPPPCPLQKYRVNFTGVTRGSLYYQCVYLGVANDQPVMEAAAAARRAYGMTTGPYMPHLSLLYRCVRVCAWCLGVGVGAPRSSSHGWGLVVHRRIAVLQAVHDAVMVFVGS